MTEIEEFFAHHARLNRRTLARFAGVPVGEVNEAADDLGFGAQLRLDEAEEVLAEMEEDDEAEEVDAPAARRSDDEADDGEDDP